jgi:hypothetical protein
MPAASVQRVIKGGVTASMSIGSGDGWATPTAGNLLVVVANADNVVSAPSGSGTWSTGPSVVDNNAGYAWYKFATGTETTIICAPGASADIVLVALEYSGITAFDVQNSSTISGTPGTLATSNASVTTTQANGLVVAAACLGGANAAIATGPAWTGGLTNVLTGNSQSPATNLPVLMTTFVGELLDAGATGVHSQAASWTNGYTNAQELVLAFKATSAATGPVARQLVVGQAVNRSFTY